AARQIGAGAVGRRLGLGGALDAVDDQAERVGLRLALGQRARGQRQRDERDPARYSHPTSPRTSPSATSTPATVPTTRSWRAWSVPMSNTAAATAKNGT